MRGVSRDLKPIIKQLVGEGFKVTKTQRGHVRWQGPDGRMTVTPSNMGDVRSIKNVRMRLRQIGAAL